MKALVTGGGGFLGGAVVSKLLARGDEVRSFSRGDYPELADRGVELIRGDLTDPEAVTRAAEGRDTVFHIAAKAGIWGRYNDFHSVNVMGTDHVIQACLTQGVQSLVYTSSPSVVFHGQDMAGVDESVPYPDRYSAPYPNTKAQAERMVLAANSEQLATCALRPHLIWGPRDTNIVPRLLARAKAGRLIRVSGGPYLIDTIYIDNAAQAHLLAADRLKPGSPPAGKAYFITNGEPRDINEIIDGILEAGGRPPIRRILPPWLLKAAGWLFENLYTLLRLKGEPPMTLFAAHEITTAHWFDISAARRDLGYSPEISIREGLLRLKEWLADHPYA